MRRIIRIIPAVLLAMTAVAQGQGAGAGASSGTAPAKGKKEDLEEAAEKIKKAKETMDLEKAREAAEGMLKKLPPKAGETVREAIESPENRGKLLDAAKSAAGSLLPEAQKMLKKEPAPAGATPAPEDDPPPAASPAGPVPRPLPPLATAAATPAGANAVTIESDDSSFDLKQAIFIYSGHVRVRHPQFYIECEELEVHMVKEDEVPEKKAPAKNDPILSKGGGKKNTDSRIKMAIARGPMVTIEKLTENGDVQRGNCKRAVYRGATGEIIMSEYPQVQRGNVLHIATDPSTEMTFDPDGRLHTRGGRQRTVVLPSDGAQGASPAGALPKSNPN